MPNVIQNEPIIASAVVTVLTGLAAHFGFKLDASTTAALSVIVLALASWVARQLSTPVKTAQAKIDQAAMAPPGAPVPRA